MTRRFALMYCALFPAALLLSACGDKHGGRKEVSGEIKLEGELLKVGSISFVPLDGQDTQSGSPIANGTYKVPRAQGLKPGKYLVQITSGDGKTLANEEDAAGPGGSTNIVSMDLVPEDWNVKSTQKIEVKDTGSNKFDFAIPKKNVPKKKR